MTESEDNQGKGGTQENDWSQSTSELQYFSELIWILYKLPPTRYIRLLEELNIDHTDS